MLESSPDPGRAAGKTNGTRAVATRTMEWCMHVRIMGAHCAAGMPKYLSDSRPPPTTPYGSSLMPR